MYSKGIMWSDDCRIPLVDEVRTIPIHSKDEQTDMALFGLHPIIQHKREVNMVGRFTPNLLVCDDVLNNGIKPNRGHRAKGKVTGYGEFGSGKSEYHAIGEYLEVDSKSRYYDLDSWFDDLIRKIK
jgi:hypothetical protein